jgi:hypothetical protein
MSNPSHVKVSCKYGAPMGRSGSLLGSGVVRLQRVSLDSGGYDRGGAYWGSGEPLWVAFDDEAGERYLRAPTRKVAQERLRAETPGETLKFARESR